MKLKVLLEELQNVQEKVGASKAFCCGGTPRDRYMNHIERISDVDITTGDKSIQKLSQEFGANLAKKYNIVRKNFDDGHSAIHIGEFKMDFSSNFNVEGIDNFLYKIGITKPTEMQKEMFSRDFTCNALLLDLNLKDIIDPTHRGIKDINKKVIKTCLSPEITLTSNKNRIIRAVYLASKLDFNIDPEIIEFVQKNPESLQNSTQHVFVEKLNEAFVRDGDKASFYISKMGLWNLIPITEPVKPYYLKKDVLIGKKAYFQGGGGVNEPTPNKKKYKSDPAIVNQTRFEEPFYKNYDLYDIPGFENIGPGAGWHSMKKYKSISEFLDAKRKKMKDKYKADDSWIQDNGEITKKNPMKIRAQLLNQLLKIGIDFPIDEQIKSTIDHDGDLSNHSLEVGMASPLSMPDFEGKLSNQLNFGQDYTEDNLPIDHDLLEIMMDKYLNHEPDQKLYGLPDGFNHSEEEDTEIELNPYYGTLGPESLMYEDKWNI